MTARKVPFASSTYLWSCEGGESVILGEVRHWRRSSKPVGAVVHVTEDRATARLWARELAAGRNPSLKFRDDTEASRSRSQRPSADRPSRNS